MRRLFMAAFVTGFLLDLTGWAGNELVLSSLWPKDAALAPPPTALEFASDVMLAFVWCVVYRLSSPSWRRSKMQLAFVSAGIVWLGAIARTLMFLNSGYLSLRTAIATTLVALATFVVVAPLLPRLLPDRVVTPV